MSWREELDRCLRSWEETPYAAGQRLRGRGVDCTNFVDAVLEEMHGLEPRVLPPFDPNGGVHDARGAAAMCRQISARYPNVTVRGPYPVESGDVLVYRRGRGAGHVLIVGLDPRAAWHADHGTGVCFTSVKLITPLIMRVWRPTEKESWLSSASRPSLASPSRARSGLG